MNAEYKHQWYLDNRERILLKRKWYYELNKDRELSRSKLYQKTERGKAAKRRHYDRVQNTPARREHRNAVRVRCYQNDNTRRRILGACDQAKRRVRILGGGIESDYAEFVKLSLKLDARCAYCGSWLAIAGASVDHILPVSRGGTNTRENLCLCCLPCNKSKNNRTVEEWRCGFFDLV